MRPFGRRGGTKGPPGDRPPIDLVRNYVRTVPADVGLRVLTRYLLRGGVADAPAQSGVLIPEVAVVAAAAAAPPPPDRLLVGEGRRERERVDDDFAAVRRERLPLLSAFVLERPGLLHALLIEIVDFVLSVEGGGAEPSGATTAGSDDGDARRRVGFLTSWARCLLSREFHDRLRVRPDESPKGNDNDGVGGGGLARPDVLREAGLPLRSLLRRCEGGTACASHGQGTRDLAFLFKEALGGTAATASSNSNCDAPAMCMLPSPKRRRLSEEKDEGGGTELLNRGESDGTVDEEGRKEHKTEKDGTDDAVLLVGTMAPNNDEKGDKSKQNCQPAMEGVVTPHPSKLPLSSSLTDRNEVGHHVAAARDDVVVPSSFQPPPSKCVAWVRCDYWEPCAIGTLPGHL